MQLLASEEYGLRCLLQVAEQTRRADAPPLQIQAIARAEGLSPEYVAKLLRSLRLGGLVVSTRGAAGGYRLARPAEEISVWDAISVLGGDFFSDSFCSCHPGARTDCVRSTNCAVRALWRSLASVLRRELQGIQLGDLRRDEISMGRWLQTAERIPLEIQEPGGPSA